MLDTFLGSHNFDRLQLHHRFTVHPTPEYSVIVACGIEFNSLAHDRINEACGELQCVAFHGGVALFNPALTVRGAFVFTSPWRIENLYFFRHVWISGCDSLCGLAGRPQRQVGVKKNSLAHEKTFTGKTYQEDSFYLVGGGTLPLFVALVCCRLGALFGAVLFVQVRRLERGRTLRAFLENLNGAGFNFLPRFRAAGEDFDGKDHGRGCVLSNGSTSNLTLMSLRNARSIPTW